MELIKINCCSARDLELIPGVGTKIAEKILAIRDSYGNITPEKFSTLGIRDLPLAMSRVDFQPYVPTHSQTWSSSTQTQAELTHDLDRTQEFMDNTLKVIHERQAQANVSPAGDRLDRIYRPEPQIELPGSMNRQVQSPPYSYTTRQGTYSDSRNDWRQDQRGDYRKIMQDHRYGLAYGQHPGTQINEFVRPSWSFPSHSVGPQAFDQVRSPMKLELRDPYVFGNLRTKSVNIPKSITYDGKSDWRAFITKFATYADREGWNSTIRRDVLSWILEGKASEFYSRLVERDPYIDYFEVVNRLAKRFDIKDLPETIQMHFTYATQHQKESLVEWSDRVVNMAMQAYPDLTDNQIYKQAVLRFCQGCLDKEAGLYAINQRPQSIKEAIDRVRWFQHTSQAVYGRSRKEIRSIYEPDLDPEIRAARPSPNSERESKKQVHFQEPVGQTISESRLSQRMDELEQKMTQLTESMATLTMAVKRRARSPIRNKTCFNCGKEGHWRADCKAEIKTEAKKVSAVYDPLLDEESDESEEALNKDGSEQ